MPPSTDAKIVEMPVPTAGSWLPAFSLANLLVAMAAWAIACMLYPFWALPPLWLVIPYGFIVSAGIPARRANTLELAWGIFVLGWIIVLWDLTGVLINSFMSIGTPNPEEYQYGLVLGYFSSMALPCVLIPGRSAAA